MEDWELTDGRRGAERKTVSDWQRTMRIGEEDCEEVKGWTFEPGERAKKD